MKNPSRQKLQRTDSRKRIFIWSLYDFANTSYSIVVVTFLFAVYFKQTIAEGKPIGDFYWSLGTSVSMLITAVISPILGAIADHSLGKKKFLLFFTILCIASTSIMYFLGEGSVAAALSLFIISNIGFEAGLVFYDAFLPELTEDKNFGRVSGYGFAMGYLGSLAVLALAYPLIQENMIKETFPLSALFFFVFSIPLFLFLKEKRKKTERSVSYAVIGFRRVAGTLKNLRNYKNLAWFLLAYFFYIEGVNTVIYFSGNYASTTLNFSMQELIVFFIIVQTTAILGSVLFGILSDSFGQKRAIFWSLVTWIVTLLLAYYTSSSDSPGMAEFAELSDLSSAELLKYSFYFIGLLAGSVMGATQSTSRSLMSQLTPEEKKTEFFGFYSFFGKSSAILGPLVFGYVSYVTADQRLAILSIIFFFAAGLLVLRKVNDKPISLRQTNA